MCIIWIRHSKWCYDIILIVNIRQIVGKERCLYPTNVVDMHLQNGEQPDDNFNSWIHESI